MATDTHITSRPAAPTAAQLRAMMAEAVERLIAAMDALDAPDEDMEPSLAGEQCRGYPVDAESDHSAGMADDEPTLGSTTCMNQERAWANHGDGFFAGGEYEPSLGWAIGRAGHPEMALCGYDDDDREVENEHGDDINDLPQDDNELDGSSYDDAEPFGDIPGGDRNRGPYRPSVNVIGDSDLDAGPLGYRGR